MMCLLIGSGADEDAWAPMKPLVRALSARRIAQVWLNHTGHNSDRSYGTKTKEWEMDTVIGLSKEETDAAAVRLEFRKARLRTPETADQFKTLSIRFVNNEWISEGAAPIKKAKQTEVEAISVAILAAYERLADGVEFVAGLNGAKVSKVNVDALRAEVKSRGFLDSNEKGQLTSTSRSNFRRAKAALISAGKLIESDGLIWRA
jgi:hypothetical protein